MTFFFFCCWHLISSLLMRASASALRLLMAAACAKRRLISSFHLLPCQGAWKNTGVARHHPIPGRHMSIPLFFHSFKAYKKVFHFASFWIHECWSAKDRRTVALSRGGTRSRTASSTFSLTYGGEMPPLCHRLTDWRKASGFSLSLLLALLLPTFAVEKKGWNVFARVREVE